MSATLEAVACCAPLAAPTLSVEEAEGTAELFKALGDPARVRIVNVIATASEPVCACVFNESLELSQPTVSHHLKKLDGRRLARARAARQVGVLLAEAGGGRGSGRCRRSERGVLLMATTADELRDEVRRRYAESARRGDRRNRGLRMRQRLLLRRRLDRERGGSAKFGEVSTTPSSAASSPMPRCSRHSAAATRPQSPICRRVTRSSTSDRAAAST